MHARVSAKLHLHNIWRGEGGHYSRWGQYSPVCEGRGGGGGGVPDTALHGPSIRSSIATHARPCSAAREQKLGLIVSVAP